MFSRIRFGEIKTLSVTPHSGHWNATRPGLPANESIVATVCIPRLHCRQIAWFGQLILAPPSRSLLDAEQIRELISGGMKTDAKQIRDKLSYGRLRIRTKHDVLNPTQSDTRLFSLYSFFAQPFLNSLRAELKTHVERPIAMGRLFSARTSKRAVPFLPKKYVCVEAWKDSHKFFKSILILKSLCFHLHTSTLSEDGASASPNNVPKFPLYPRSIQVQFFTRSANIM